VRHQFAGLPKGAVVVYVTNYTVDQVQGYVQGAPRITPPLYDGTVTFEDVANLGPGVLQSAVGIDGGYRTLASPPLFVSFTNQSTGDYDTCAWTFGDGGTSSSCTNPTHTYATLGFYTVALTVSGPGGTHMQTRDRYIAVQEEYRVYLPLALGRR
jgi:hypothetical protein